MSPTNALFSPLQVGDITIRNRIGMSALTRNRAPGTIPNDVMAEYYVQRVVGGAGLIVTEGILITRQGTEWSDVPGIWSSEQVAGWKKITDAVHSAGGYIYAQLWHVGRVAHPEAPEQILAGVPVYAPSAIAARGGLFRQLPGKPGYVTPTAVDDPWILVKLFKDAAINAKEAGFDGVELHGASGYLITQFLDSSSNQRTDKWGGSVENRSRFALEVLKAVIEVFGHNVAVKINPCGGSNDVGMPLQETLDTFNYFISEADKLQLSYIVFLRYVQQYDTGFDGKIRGTPHNIVESYRGLVKNSKFFVNGEVTPEEGAELISSGKVDGVFFGFAFIPNPDLVKRIEHGKPLEHMSDFSQLQWSKDGKDLRVGYTDYPLAVY